MTLPVWLSLFSASAIISLTPGAGAVNTMSNSISVGWRRSIWGIVGQQVALLVHIAIVAAGVGVLVAGSPVVFNIIRVLGAAYLAYLGVRLMLTRPVGGPAGVDPTVLSSESAGSLMRRGFWVNLLNPKAIVFFLAFMPQFIRPEQPLVPQYAILTATVVLVDTLVMWGVFAVAAKPFRRAVSSARGQRVMNTVFGSLFVGVAALLLFVH